MNTPDELGPPTALPQPDAAMRADLSKAARQIDVPRFRALVNDVLAGRRGVRDVLRTPEFRRLAGPRITNLTTGINRLTNAERAHLLDLNAPAPPTRPAPSAAPPTPATRRSQRPPVDDEDDDISGYSWTQ
ncbi:MAG: hypothetical protein J2P17_14090 [Mycobacterium sp.]|nr:hypothetical protein [Mycobacterium sp.]